ncbi:NAD(P)-binding protein [Bimuria novae-zelandiae CBS 107.79]|uniref:NAD(P)-binding protein n=1 Tax=Bimuria novae-zelandiae CBS 107.79 TaxID=1447943 RepID=A0A6A5VK48_9PLEO|nr:NAD(P)-binding protein [Bimuria novae-zelandiae CBS 107.79]
MSRGKVLVTGVTGLIGFRVLVDVLEAGYAARAVVRSTKRFETQARHPLLRHFIADGRLECTDIPDFSALNAWDDALEGITFIMHIAWPLLLPTLDPEIDIYEPAVRGSDSLLEAALKTPTLKRIIFTSSIMATMPYTNREGESYGPESHVRALDEDIKENCNLGVSVPMQYNDAVPIARKHFPEAFERGLLLPGEQPSEAVVWNASATEAMLDMKFKGFEEMVVDVVSQYLELLSAETLA